ncbi:hypothetical protein GTW37_25915 [Streptomyces sp. SID4931]|nr:hypothetical protein [Streptomyces sp. SID4931]
MHQLIASPYNGTFLIARPGSMGGMPYPPGAVRRAGLDLREQQPSAGLAPPGRPGGAV